MILIKNRIRIFNQNRCSETEITGKFYALFMLKKNIKYVKVKLTKKHFRGFGGYFMKKLVKLLSVVLCVAVTVCIFSSCSKKTESTPVKIDDFRVTSYILADGLRNLETLDKTHFEQITDIILFGCANFDEEGNLILDDDFDTVYENLKLAIQGTREKRIYLNILGPKSQSESEDWDEQMKDQAQRHTNAFESGKLEENIKNTLQKYGFKGVYFDYEFPIKNKYWKSYSEFLLSLNETLKDEYDIGLAVAGWDAKLSDRAKSVVDRVELMSYDLWDDDGNHATYEIAQDDIKKLKKAGFDMAKVDLGLPFYARPTDKGAYWYDYANYYDKIDENGLYKDDETGLTFSFNTPELIGKKTKLAIDEGLGGVMVWHHACDVPADNEKSLYNAVENSIQAEKA